MSENAEPEPKFKIGDRVIHETFGKSTVTLILPRWGDARGLFPQGYYILPDRGENDEMASEISLKSEDATNPFAS